MVENSVLNGIEDPDPEVAPLKVFPNPFTGSLSFSIDRDRRNGNNPEAL
ncbi:MAG: hypothetical protein MZV63_08095 [Marinilabiliales bacterium]|nr:hypothetical protein [Marinilabiliales bacterium]